MMQRFPPEPWSEIFSRQPVLLYPSVPPPPEIGSDMVFILDVNSEIGAHVRSNLYYLISLRLLIMPKAVTNLIF